jgi:hypothetical protein
MIDPTVGNRPSGVRIREPGYADSRFFVTTCGTELTLGDVSLKPAVRGHDRLNAFEIRQVALTLSATKPLAPSEIDQETEARRNIDPGTSESPIHKGRRFIGNVQNLRIAC